VIFQRVLDGRGCRAKMMGPKGNVNGNVQGSKGDLPLKKKTTTMVPNESK